MVDTSVVPVGDQTSALLDDLISDAKEQASSHRKRNSPFIFQSVHPADVDCFVENGWVVQRTGKQKVRLKKEKSHDKRLEDRFWCLLFKMGYKNLSGAKFKIKFIRKDGSKGSKQIDAFACDNETVLVVECKSKKSRGRKGLAKDIQETIW